MGKCKSSYPASPDPGCIQAVQAQMNDLLRQPQAPLFSLIDHAKLTAAFAANPTLPGMFGILPSPMAAAAFLIDVNEWLTEYRISLV